MKFKAGNYNKFEALVTKKIPSVNTLIRTQILPSIENSLKSMLDTLEGVEGKNLNVSQIVDKDGLTGFTCAIVYDVEAFKVPEAPPEAIQEDQDALANSLTGSGAHLKDISINTNEGSLFIEYEIPLQED